MKITIPTNRSWQVSYFGDLFSNIVETCNVDLHYSQGKVRTGQYLYPHTVTDDVDTIAIASDFVLSDADNSSGTMKYWAACEVLYNVPESGIVSLTSSVFVSDTVTLTPTVLVDADIVNWGVTEGFVSPNTQYNGLDILVVSQPDSLALLDYAATESFSWVSDWWSSDLIDVFATTGVYGGGIVEINIASTADYNTDDVILITNSGNQTANYSGPIVVLSASTLVTGLTLAETQTMAVGSPITGSDIQPDTTIASVTQASTDVSTDGALILSVPSTGSGTVTATWSDLIPLTIDGQWTITVRDGTHFTLNDSSTLNVFGQATNVSFSGNIERVFNKDTGFYYLAQVPLALGVPHILLPFGVAPLLFVTDGNQVHSIASPGEFSSDLSQSLPGPASVEYARLVFRPGYTINWACATSLKIYFGLMDKRGLSYPSLVEEYDPFNEQVREIVIQNGATIGYLVDNNVHVIDVKGNLKSYNGNTFDVYAQMAAAEIDGFTINLPHRNGIFVSENRINMLIPADGEVNYYEGGWWTYELDTKRLYHQGDAVPDKDEQTAFGTTSGDAYGAFFPTTTIGQNLAGVSISETVGPPLQTGIYSTGFQLGIFYNSIGRITLGKIPSSEIDTVYRNILVKYNPVLDRLGLQNGTIVVKYKTQDYPFPEFNYSGTWIDATSFSMSDTSRMVIGAEMIVTSGDASGASFQVTGINGTTVTIGDENLGFVPSDDFEFNMDYFQRFENTPPDITDNTRNFRLNDIPETATGEWVQFRIELRGLFSLEEVQIGVQPNLTVEPEQSPY